eukprot:m.106212 g.106212  ORF g.106212 m.106212 type:complete len:118 (-) comp15811_c0_seq4:3756-4109(-)
MQPRSSPRIFIVGVVVLVLLSLTAPCLANDEAVNKALSCRKCGEECMRTCPHSSHRAIDPCFVACMSTCVETHCEVPSPKASCPALIQCHCKPGYHPIWTINSKGCQTCNCRPNSDM